jgi:hypothetical protein
VEYPARRVVDPVCRGRHCFRVDAARIETRSVSGQTPGDPTSAETPVVAHLRFEGVESVVVAVLFNDAGNVWADPWEIRVPICAWTSAAVTAPRHGVSADTDSGPACGRRSSEPPLASALSAGQAF